MLELYIPETADAASATAAAIVRSAAVIAAATVTEHTLKGQGYKWLL